MKIFFLNLAQGDVVLPHSRSELLPKQIKIGDGEESGEAIASSIMKNIGQGPIVSLREPSFKLSYQTQAQPKTDKKPTQESQSDLQIRSFLIGSASNFIGIRHFS
jgi:hypothetical protein